MSKNKEIVDLRSTSGPIKIRLMDHQFNEVASGYGNLREAVEPGIYLVRTTAGGAEEEKFISVKEGEGYRDHALSAAVLSAAPLGGDLEVNAPQIEMLDRLCRNPRHSLGHGGQLVLLVRDPRGRLDPEFSLAGLELRNVQNERLSTICEEAEISENQGWAGFSVQVDPGGIILSWSSKRHSQWSVNQELSAAVGQSLWISKGWTTVVTMLAHPKRHEPRMTGMTIMMCRQGETLGLETPDGKNVAMVQEMALSGIRQGIALVPDDLLDIILNAKFRSPMAGVIGAHAMLLKKMPKWHLFDKVITNLDRLIPESPDVVALRMLGKLRRKIQMRTRTKAIDFPPMIYLGYRGLVSRDWKEGGVISPGSLAEGASAKLLPQGPWTVWKTSDCVQLDATATSLNIGSGLQSALSTMGAEMAESTKKWWQREVLESSQGRTDAATERVGMALDQIAQFDDNLTSEEVFGKLQQTGLPMATVKRVLDSMEN